MSQGQAFNKASSATLADRVTFEEVYYTDMVTGASRRGYRQCTTTYNADGTVASVTSQLVEEDKTTAVVLGANEVATPEPECVTTGAEQLDVTGAASATLTTPANSKGAKIQVDPDGSAIRWTIDGTDPTNDSFAASAGSWITVCKASDLANFRALSADGDGLLDPAMTAQLQVSYVSTELR